MIITKKKLREGKDLTKYVKYELAKNSISKGDLTIIAYNEGVILKFYNRGRGSMDMILLVYFHEFSADIANSTATELLKIMESGRHPRSFKDLASMIEEDFPSVRRVVVY